MLSRSLVVAQRSYLASEQMVTEGNWICSRGKLKDEMVVETGFSSNDL